MKLVFVHGRDQHGKDPDQLLKLWDEVLRDNWQSNGLVIPQIEKVSLPFYGDKLRDLVQLLEEPLPPGIKARGIDSEEDLSFELQLAYELMHNAGLKPEDVDARMPAGVKEKGVLQWEWVHGLLRIIERSVGLSDFALQRFTRDVYAYLKHSAVSVEVDEIVASEIPRGGPCVVVAHSLGSIVAYRVLTALESSANVSALITLGSPLGLSAVRDKLNRPLAVPRGVARWKNAYDARDVVSLKPLDAECWPVSPLIENFDGVVNGTDNAHSISGYLDDPVVGRWILDALVDKQGEAAA